MQEFFLGHPVLMGGSGTFQFQMDICNFLVAHSYQQAGTAFLDHWVMDVFWLSFPPGMYCLYTGFGRVLNFCMNNPFTCHLFLYFAPSPENRGHTLSSPWARRVVCSTQAITDWLPLCSHSACISVGFLGESCADYVFSHSQASRLDFTSSPVL